VRDIDTEERIPPEIIKGMAAWPVGAGLLGRGWRRGDGLEMAAIAAKSWAGPTSAWHSGSYLVEARRDSFLDRYGTPELKPGFCPR